nr:AKR_HP1_G0022380.mRNA.1.CDS.1 [Saccharomyces cerevisiae]
MTFGSILFMVVELDEEQQQTEQEHPQEFPMFKSAVYSILAASLVNAGTIPLGKLSDIDKIGSQTEIFPFLGGSGPYYSFPGDYGISLDLPEGCEMKQVQMVW